MTERTVSVVLKARVDGFVSGFKVASRAADDLTKSQSKMSKADAFGKVADKAAIAGLGVATAVGVAVKRFADFDASMSAVKANTGAAGAELESLRQAAITMGADSVFSAKEAADGINELGKAGLSTADIMGGGLRGSLDLAAAGQIGVAEAAETTASALTQFNLGRDQAVHVADLLTNGANKAQGGVGDLGAALNQTGLVAAATGLSIDETTAGLAAFASAGLIGSDAGTSFKTTLQRLVPQSDAAAAAMKEIGLDAYDAQGNFIGLEAVAGQLQTGMADLSQEQRNTALTTIFGSDAVRAANVLYSEGAAGIADWTSKVTEQGAAAKQAATLTDNLKGDVERLGGALDSVFISTGSGANGGLRTLTQGITGLVTAIGQVPGPLLLAGGGLTAFGLLAPKGVMAYRSYIATLSSLGVSLDSIATKSPRAGQALAATTVAAKAFGASLAVISAVDLLLLDDGGIAIEGLTKSLLESSDAAAGFSAAIVELDTGSGGLGDTLKTALDPSFFESFQRKGSQALNFLALGMADLDEPLGLAEDRLTEFDQVLSNLVSGGNGDEAARIFADISRFAKEQGLSVDELKAKLPQYTDALAGVANQASLAADSGLVLSNVETASVATAEEAAKAADAYAEALDGVKDAITRMGGGLRAEQQAIADSADALKEAQKTAGDAKATRADDEASLRALSASYLEVAAAQVDMGRGAGEVGATMTENRAKFIETATAMGINATFAGQLATAYGLVPKDVATQVKQIGAETASQQVTNLKTVIRGLDGKTVTVQEAGKAKPSKDNVLALDGAIFGLAGKTVKVQELGSTASGDRVVRFNGKIFTLKGKTVTVSETGATAARGRVESLQRTIRNTNGKTVTLTTRLVTVGRAPSGGFSTAGGVTRAAGGPIYGPGTGTSDSIPAMLSNGEHVLTAAEVIAAGGHAAVYALRAAIKSGSLPKFADGGAVASTSRAAQYASRSVPASSRPIVNVTSGGTNLAPLQASIAALGADIRNMRTVLKINDREFASAVAAANRAHKRLGGNS